ncbi:CHC2 zinc finger domain-containing protein, partial [Myxococcota bacterium]|nr:CHC2 zinc finger domain-containing protein [Myxococcota bacterium]
SYVRFSVDGQIRQEAAMARVSEAEIQRLKREVSVERLAQARGVKLRQHGKDLMGLCPFHDDHECGLSRYSTACPPRSIVTRPGSSLALRDRLGTRLRGHKAGRRGGARQARAPRRLGVLRLG